MTPLTIRNLIGGEWVGDPVIERRNPARPDDVVAVTPVSDETTVETAVTAAQEARDDWAATPSPVRGTILMDAAEILRRRHDQVAHDLVMEEGKTIAEARGEVRRAIDVLRYFGSEGWRLGGDMLPSSVPDTVVYTRREPLGVVGLITPWNFPIAIPAWKVAPALISGNTAVLKPADLTPASAHHLVSALTEAGLPAGVLNVVHGKGSVVGEALIADPRVAGVSFTGSTTVGEHIRQVVGERRGRVQLEMGGKNALVVLDDADVDRAAQLAAAGGFALTGQACTATSRVVCTPGVLDAVVEALTKQSERYRPGDGLDDQVLMGPVVSEQQLATDRAAVAKAQNEGARVVTGGESPGGLLFAPTVLTNVHPGDFAAQEEIFGPILAILSADDLESAVNVVNNTRYGLAAGICTTNLAAAQYFATHVQAGVVKVNRPTTGLDLNVPFGGVKDSSTNTFREQGREATEFYTWSKSVYLGWDVE